MLPLNTENIACVFKTGVLTKTDIIGRTFGQFLNIPDTIEDPLRAAAWWVRKERDQRWRVIIFYLDCVGETEIAD